MSEFLKGLADLMENKVTPESAKYLKTAIKTIQKEPEHITKGSGNINGFTDGGHKAVKNSIPNLNEEYERNEDEVMADIIRKASSNGTPVIGAQSSALPPADPADIIALVSGRKSKDIIAEKKQKENELFEENIKKQQITENKKPKDNYQASETYRELNNNKSLSKGDMLLLIEEVFQTKSGKLFLKEIVKEIMKDELKPILLETIKGLKEISPKK